MARTASRTKINQNRVSMAERIRLADWRPEPLGAPTDWPALLKITLKLMLDMPSPACLAWGDSLISFYNDAYLPLVGNRVVKPGAPSSELWGEAWTAVAPIVAGALSGQPGLAENLQLPLDRHGYPEHSWWTFACTPVTDEAGRIGGVLCVGHETTREVEAHAPLPAQRERFALLFDQAPVFIAYLSGPHHVFELYNHPLGIDIAPGFDLLGKSIREAFPNLEGQRTSERLDEAFRTGRRQVENARKMADAAGQHELFVNEVYQPVRDEDGSVVGVFLVVQDVTKLVNASNALRDREARLKLAMDSGRMAIWDVDFSAGSMATSPELNLMLGLAPDARPLLSELQDHYYPGELDRLRRLMSEAQQRGDRFFETEYRHIRPDTGEVRWLLIRAMMVVSDETGTARPFGVIMDITDRKQSEERLKLLALEVDHRANNLLATVQSIVTLTRAGDVSGFRENVLGRISALAHAHRLLAESRWAGAKLSRVVQEELQPFMAGGRVHLEGPDASLAPAVAQGLAVTLHELVTNAVKHGALTSPDGEIVVSWTAPDQDRIVRMTWLERGGPPVFPPMRVGFGMNLLRRALAGPTGGSVKIAWRPEGLCSDLHVPVL